MPRKPPNDMTAYATRPLIFSIMRRFMLPMLLPAESYTVVPSTRSLSMSGLPVISRVAATLYSRAEVLTPPEAQRFEESNRLCCGKTILELGQEVIMPLLVADPIAVLAEQREALERLVRTHSTPQQLAMRARIILHAAEAMGVRASARELGTWPKTVRYWRKRWGQAADGHSVLERLADAPRSGAPATYTAEQICAVIA